MGGEMPNPPDLKFPEGHAQFIPSEVVSDMRLNNISVQTGEEFSVDFIQDRATPRVKTRRLVTNVAENGHINCQSSHVGYEDLTGILGLRRSDSDGYSDTSNSTLVKGSVADAKNVGHIGRTSRISSEKAHKMTENRVDEYTEPTLSSEPSQAYHNHPHTSRTSESPKSWKVKFLCSFGGKILPRPADGKLRYVGGDTRLISIRENLSWKELVQKTLKVYNQPHIIKYQLPGEDLDALISVSSDEDLQNMMEEYYGLEKADGSLKLRIFLISQSESENSSLDSRRLQTDSEYKYIVAVNNIAEPSPTKSSSGNSLSSQLGYNLDSSPSSHRDSPFPQLIISGGVNPSSAVFMHHHSRQFFVTPQSAVVPIGSPPFSPKTNQQRDAEYSQKKPLKDQFLDQPSGNNYETDSGLQGALAKSQQRKNGDVEVSVGFPGAFLQNHRPMVESVNPLFTRNESDLGVYTYYGKTSPAETSCQSEKGIRNPDDIFSWISGSNDSTGPLQGMPHACSDSKLHDKGERIVSSLSELAESYLDITLPFSQKLILNNQQEGAIPCQENSYFNNADLPYNMQSAMPGSSQRRPKFSYADQPELHLRDESYYQSAHCADEENHDRGGVDRKKSGLVKNYSQHHLLGDTMMQMNDKIDLHQQNKLYHLDLNSVPDNSTYKSELPNADYNPQGICRTSVSSQEPEELESSIPKFTICCTSHSDSHLEKFSGNRMEEYATDISVREYETTNSMPRKSSHPRNSDVACEDVSVMAVEPPVSWQRSSLETLNPKIAAETMEKEYGNEISSDIVGTSIHNPFSDIPPCIESSYLEKNLENGIESSGPLATLTDTNLSLNLCSKEPSTWSLFQNNMDDILKKEVSLLDQDTINCPNSGVSGLEHEFSIYQEDIKPACSMHDNIKIEAVVTVEDVTDSVPSGIPATPAIIPHVLDEVAEDEETHTTSLPKVIVAWSSTSEPRSEDGKDDEREVEGSISDAAIAEIEAGVYGLQIIRNADLEELRELGSGTFGTVYHGKWRGTDVAIKRIKKSCFAGRLSEQEKLTKDFWREAQILSKLHHPNVVAFYGVVPDGAGGTLATVTEFMVNGSLRHVLLRKDSFCRTLDRRKRLIIAMDAAFGMEYLHSKNIVHFDLKCDNLLVNLRDSHRPICKVGDFGLSRIKRNTLVSGGVRGTLPWMAPELLNGSSTRVSEKVDVFSFGIAMWEILTSEEPYANMHCGAIIGGILNNTLRPPIPERCDSGWRKLMEQCWSADPAVRPSFTEITDRLRSMSQALQQKGQTHVSR
ncbi:uncharacterized protein [Typha angustifolia]|uniref:uncharacterized protein isoform X1 n=1 Tax=Typha angustifolia TaxID=59011 RepID=UPI003C2E7E85